MGDRRQLVSAMHALLENAITYSYDNSKVVVTGTVQRSNPNLEHPALAGSFAGPELEPDTGELPAVGAHGEDSGPATPESHKEGPVEPVFTPETLEQVTTLGGGAVDGTPDDATTVAASATSTTAPAPLGGAPGDTAGTVPAEPSAVALPNWRIEERDNVRLSVQDHGIGIPARDLDRIFERFYRVDHGRSRDTGGTGLGLSIVRHVANNHQGWVDVESREGEGSTFTLVLPIQAERVA